MPITSPITGAARLGACVSIAAALTMAIGSGAPRAEELKVVATIKPIHALGVWAVENEVAVAEARRRFEEQQTEVA